MAPQEVKFTENRLGGVALVIDGCKYRINRRSGTTVYWRCFYRWCRANAVVEDGKLKSSCGNHICQQPLNGGAHTKGGPGRHHQRQLQQQTPSVPPVQQTEVQSFKQRPRLPVASSSGGARSGPSVKMATRAAQGSTTQTLTRNANKAKVALRSQKPPTNNNMVVRRKSKATEEDNKSSVLLQQPASTDSPQLINSVPETNSPPPKQVRLFIQVTFGALINVGFRSLSRVPYREQRTSRALWTMDFFFLTHTAGLPFKFIHFRSVCKLITSFTVSLNSCQIFHFQNRFASKFVLSSHTVTFPNGNVVATVKCLTCDS